MDIDALRSSLQANPADAVALEKIQAALMADRKLKDLRDIYEQVFTALKDSPDKEKALRVVDNAAKTHEDDGIKHWLNAQLGLIFWKQLDSLDRAEVYFRRVQDAAGHAGGMVGEFYVEFYAKRDNWRRLEELFQKQGLPDLELKRKLAQIAEERDKKDKALAFWQEVYNADAADEEVFQKLRALYGEAAKWHSLVELLKKRLGAVSGDVDKAVALHLEMVEIYREHIKSETKVIAELQSLLKLAPGHREATTQLENLYEGMKRWPDLVRVLQERIDHSTGGERVALHGRIAQIMLERFSNASEAIKHYQAILDLDTQNLEAVRKLKDLYEQRKTWEQYVEVAQAEIRLAGGTAEERTKALIQLAALASERIRLPRIAVGLWEQIRENEPGHPEALAQLEQLYERDKAYDKLADVLEARVDQAGDAAARITLLERLGVVVSTRLKDEDRTARVWEGILALQTGHRKAFDELRKRYLGISDWDALEALYRRHGNLQELTRTFEAQVKSESDKGKIALYTRIATLRREEGATEKAVAALEEVLAIDSGNAAAARALLPDYEALGKFDKLVSAYDVVLAATEDAAARRPLLVAKAAISETRLGDPDGAFFCVVEAFKADPTDATLRGELDRLAEASNNLEVFADVLEELLDVLGDGSEAQLAATLRVAAVRHQLGEHKRALAHYNRVLKGLDSNNSTARAAIESIYRETEQWDELIDVLQSKLASGTLEDEAEKSLRFEIGAVWRDKLGEADAAMGVYREMMERFPNDLRIYDELAQLYQVAQEWGEVVAVYERKLSALTDRSDTTPADLAELRCRLGIEYGRQGDTGRAVEYFIDALSADASSQLAVDKLVDLLDAGEHEDVIASALEPVFQRRKQWADLARVVEIQLQHARGDRAKRGFLERLVKLYEKDLSDNAQALDAASRLFELDPESDTRGNVDRLAGRLGAWKHLADLFEKHVERVEDTQRRLGLHDTIARTVYEKDQDFLRAEKHYRAILDLEPAHAATLDALEELYGATEQHELLLEILRSKEGIATSDEARIAFRFQTASLLADALGRPQDAIDDLRAILGMSPGNAMALARLDELYTRGEAWLDLHDILEQRIQGAETDEEKVALLVRLAELKEVQLEASAEAVLTYADVLIIDVVQADAVAALERLFDDPELAVVIAPILEATYQAQNHWEGLVRVYTVMEASSEDAPEKVDYHYRIAGLYERDGNSPPHAFAHYSEAYRLDPSKAETARQLLRLADALGEHRSLTALFKDKVDDIADTSARRETWRTVARLLAEKVGDTRGAIEALRTVKDLAPQDVPATDALIGLYRKTQQYDELVQSLKDRAQLEPAADAKKALLLEAGEIAGAAIGADEAVAVYESVLAVDPADRKALDALGDLYESTENWPEMCRILGRKIELETDLEAKKAFARELAGVQETRLEDDGAAIETQRTILSWDEADLGALSALDELFQKSERWLELQEILDAQLALGAGDRAELQLRKAAVYRDQMGDVGQAIQVLAAILNENPKVDAAIEALEALVSHADEREQAYAVLRPVLAAQGDWTRVYHLWNTMVGFREVPAERIAALHEMGALAEVQLSRADLAFDCYGRALKEDGNHAESMAAVERLARANTLWEALVKLLEECSADLSDPLAARSLRLRAAEVLKDEISDFDRAIVAYSGVLEDDEQSAEALQALDELYTATDAHQELGGILARRIEATVDTADKIALYFRLADVAENRLGDQDRPFECFREVFYLDPQHAGALDELERLLKAGIHRADVAELLEPVYTDRAQWDKLHLLLEKRLEITRDAGDRLDLQRRLAELNQAHLGRPVDALHWYGEAFRLDPQDDGVLDRMEALASETQEFTRLKEVLLAVAISSDDASRKVSLWHKAAGIVLDKLHDREQAERIYELVLHEDPADLTALEALDKLYEAQQRWAELEVCLDRRIDAVEFDDDKMALLRRLGELLRDKLARPEEAVSAYERLLELNEVDPVALEALNALYRDTGEWEPLFNVVRRQADTANDDATRLEHLRDLAFIAENQLGRTEDALQLWEDALGIAGNDLEAIRHVERLNGDLQNHQGLADAMERELTFLGDDDLVRSVDIYRDLGRLYGGPLDDPFKAQEAWQKLLAIEDNDVEALRALRKIHQDSSNLEALAAVLDQMVASLRFSGDELLSQWLELAQIHTESLPDAEKAIRCWVKVRELDPRSLEAVEALERLYTDAGRWADAVAILTVKAGLVSAKDAVGVWMTLGEVQQFQLSNPTAAAEAYAKVLAHDASHADATERLDAIYTDQSRWAELSALIEKRTELTERDDDKRDLYVRLAELQRDKIGDLGTALLYFQAAHRVRPGELDVLGAFEAVATATESWADLHDEYVEALTGVSDDTDRQDLCLRDARLLRDRLGRKGEAAQRFREVLELSPEHSEALLDLGKLLGETEQWEELTSVLQRRLDACNDSFERGLLGLELGAVCRDKLGDTQRAVEAFRGVLDLGVGEREAIDALEALFREAQRWEDLIEILDAKARSGLGNETAIRLEIGGLKEQQLHDAHGAIEVYESILQFDEANREALDRLLQLYGEIDDMERLTSVYERLLHTADNDEDQISYCEALAILHKDVHQNPEAAADYYFRVLTIDSKHEAGLTALEELYTTLERWEDLIEIVRRRLEQSEDTATWTAYKEKSARLYAERLSDRGSAIDAWQQLLDRVPSNRAALDALEALYREDGNWERVQEVLAQKSEYASGSERMDLLAARAQIVLDELSDPDLALSIVKRAEVDSPEDARVSTLLESIYSRKGDWDAVIDTLRRRGVHSRTDADRAAAEVAMAIVYEEKVHDGEQAIQHYERAIEIAPGDSKTADRLSTLYLVAEDWIKAETLLSLIVRRAPAGADDAWLARVNSNLGLSLENLLRPGDAVRAYESAHRLAPGNLQTMKALGRCAEAQGDLTLAEAIYTELVESVGHGESEAELVGLYKTLGQLAFKSGNSEKARAYLEKTVALQPGSNDALKNLMTLCEQQGYWQGVVDYAKELQDLLTDPLERFELQVRVGDVFMKHIKDTEEAVRSYRAALDFQPDSKAAHFKIFQVLVEAERHDEAVEILERLVGLEADIKRKAQYLGAIGDIFREKIGDTEKAVDYYERALDADVSLLKLFRNVDEILTTNKNWRRLQQSYRAMFDRVKEDETQEQLQYKLLFNLGEIYRTRLNQFDRAKVVFEKALEIKSRDVKSLQILAELYERDGQTEEALHTARRLLELEHGNVEHYRNIKRLLYELKDYDGAWVACAVLTLLGQANEREDAFYKQHAPKQIAEDATTPTTNIWAEALFSKGEDILLGQIFWTLIQGLGAQLVTKELKDFGLKKKNAIDPKERELLTHVYGHAVRVLGLNPAPELYHLPKIPGLQVAETLPPVLLVGDAARQGQTDQELGFVVAKSLTYFHPLHVAVALVPLETLEVLFSAALRLFVPQWDIGNLDQNPGFQDLVNAINDMTPQLRQALQGFVVEFAGRGQKQNLTRWLNQIELSANHAGLLLANDPLVAGQIIKNEAHRNLFQAPSRLATRDKLVDLAVYALSEDYMNLRKSLGLAIESEG